MIGEHNGRSHRGKGIALGQRSGHDGVAHGHVARRSQVNVIPNADVATANGRNPVPTDGGMERGVISAEDTAVEVGILFSLDFDTARISISDNEHLQFVVIFFKIGCDVKYSALEGTLNAT